MVLYSGKKNCLIFVIWEVSSMNGIEIIEKLVVMMVDFFVL